MASARTENLGPVVMGINKQNGQFRGQPKPPSQSGPGVGSGLTGKVPGVTQKTAGSSQEGPGIR